MEKHAALVMLTSTVAASLVTAAAGIIVALPATCAYNYLHARFNLFENRAPTQGLRLERRISAPPAFALIAAPVLAVLVVVYTTFASFHPPLGFVIEVPSAGCESNTADPMIMLHIANAGRLLVNNEQQEWNTLESRRSEVFWADVHRTVCLSADENVPFQTVADVIDIIKNTPRLGDISLPRHHQKIDHNQKR